MSPSSTDPPNSNKPFKKRQRKNKRANWENSEHIPEYLRKLRFFFLGNNGIIIFLRVFCLFLVKRFLFLFFRAMY